MRRIQLALAALLFPQIVPALAEPIHGRLQLQDVYAQEGPHSLAATFGARNRNDALSDLRLSWQPVWNAWRFDFAYRLAFDAGDTPTYTTRIAAANILPPAPPPTWWDLSDTFVERSHITATQRIDRIAIGYTGEHLVLRVGRQAVTWGAGLVFHPMDLFDPFPADATDTEYKPGTDMFYGQYLFDDGSDLQLVAVPRPAHRGGSVQANASSFAIQFRSAIGILQTVWLIARDHGDIVASVGINGALGGATWNAEIVPTVVRGNGTFTSALLNISHAGVVWNRDITYFGEYFRNGFGVDTGHRALDELPPALLDRLVRGQLFNTGRDYLSGGVLLQWSPLLQLRPTLIANLNDASFYVIAQAEYSLEDDVNLIAGAQLPVGPARSEFGGIPLTNGPTLLEPPARFYLQLRRYF